MELLLESSGFRVAEVQCRSLQADQASASRKEPFKAYCLVAQERYRSSNIMPTIKYARSSHSKNLPKLTTVSRAFAPVYRGALVHGLSLAYLRHLVQLRPYNPDHGGRSVRFARNLFIGLVLAPQFALFYLPLVMAQRMLGGIGSTLFERMKLAVSDIIRFNAIVAEKYLFRPFVGRAGYVIEI
jgi:hypothetical protein